MEQLEFFEPMRIPTVTHNDLVPRRRKNGALYIGKSDELKEAESCWEAHLARHKPQNPFCGAIRVKMVLSFTTDKRHPHGTPHASKPDADNLEKVIFDVMARLGFFTDDSHIADHQTTKAWADPAGIYVKMEEIA